jgi:hypothetical protein
MKWLRCYVTEQGNELPSLHLVDRRRSALKLQLPSISRRLYLVNLSAFVVYDLDLESTTLGQDKREQPQLS